MNNFPAMTEEQRQALIKMAKRLSSGVEGNLIANLAKVSLAALTAEPAGKFAFEPLAERYHHIKHGEAQHMEPKLPMVKLFTAPPAPVLCSPDYHDEAKRLAELHGMSFVVFRHGEAPAVADPTRVIIGFTDKGLGHDTTGDQQ